MTTKCPKCQAENPAESDFCGKCGTRIRGHVPDSPESGTCPQNSGITETLQIPIKELATGSTFAGRYQVIEELGKGGMGKVYKVFDTDIKEKVALKLLKPEIASDKETIERFSNELKYARKIRHKNVCGMYDLGKAEGTHFITMEYISGEDLKSMIRMTGSLTIGATLSIGKQVCDGLAEAHSLGVVHRDLKPQNIMIDKGGNAKIMDFGIARSIKEKGITGPSVLIGTPEYMSPEQAEAKEIDHRSDIYSLGIILYEMATGRVPFEGDTALSIAMKHKGEIPKNPKDFNPNIPDDLSGVILKCLEKERAKRYQAASEVRSELEKIEKGIPTTERVVPEKKTFTSREITVKFNLKKVFLPVIIIIALAVAGLVIWRFLPKKEAVPAKLGPHSIAVLPFMDLSPKKDYEYLCEGIPETLINALLRIKDLRVPARASAFSFKGKEQDIGEIRQKLNVDTVLRGSIQVIGDRLRITPQLISTADGNYVWSESYDRKLEDVFAIQDEIAREIVKALKITLLGEKETPLIKNYTANPEAYQAYLKGRFYWNKRTEETMKKSIAYFEQAIALDPSYALAYIGLADAYITLGEWYFLRSKEAFPKAKEAILKALEIDDSLGEAHTSLAAIKRDFDWDLKGAEIEFKRAIELSPNYATAHQWYGESLAFMGRFDEGSKELKRAQELDPLSLIINIVGGGWFCYMNHEYDKGIDLCKKTLEMDPSFYPARYYLWRNYTGKKMYEEALREAQKTNQQIYVAINYAMMNRKEEARRLLADILKHPRQYEAVDIAELYFRIGGNEEGWQWLEKAYDEHSYSLIELKVSPHFDDLRLDPRFKALLKKAGLE